MRTAHRIVAGALLAAATLAWISSGAALAAGDAPRITKEELKAKLGDPSVTVIDVRYNPSWKNSGQRIAGAVREDPNEISSWAGKYRKDQLLVFYCD